MELLQGHGEWVFGLIALAAFAAFALPAFLREKKIKQSGVETDGVVLRCEYDADPDGGGSYLVYVAYQDENGARRENKGFFSSVKYNAGETIRIKYIPGEYEYVASVRNKNIAI